MPAIRYEAPTSIPEAIRLMQADPAASVMAGGTDLLVQFRAGIKRPSAFIDIKGIPDLVRFAIDSSGFFRCRIDQRKPFGILLIQF